MKKTSVSIDLGGQIITLEAGLAPQADGSITAIWGETVVLATVVTGSNAKDLDYFPLQVEYREKHYAGGVISSSRFVKREGRPSDNEILTARLIDRSIRPLFPDGFRNEVQVAVSPLSIDEEHEPEILSLIASSAALAISSLPWDGPIGALRLGQDKDGNILINPTNTQKQSSKLDLVISATKDSITMVEAGASQVSEKDILTALDTAADGLAKITQGIVDLAAAVGKTKLVVTSPKPSPELVSFIQGKVKIDDLLEQEKTLGGAGLYSYIAEIAKNIADENKDADRAQIKSIIENLLKKHIRKLVLDKNIRFDKRKPDQIRSITSEVGVLPRTHGSAIFRRGLTHALSIVTLASTSREQLIEGMKGEENKRYIHHYNMPGYSTGEPGRYGFPGRREIGHGALAERALFPVIPEETDFPYTVRVVSEILSSNGSTSQASVCGSTLALMDAGVPIKKPVAGIAMGLITDSDKYITLSDITGLEDATGDMDFKVAGTRDGITALQMDVKVGGITTKILKEALEQARIGRLYILEKMLESLDKPREKISKYAPRIVNVTIDPEKIGEIIGPGGRIIKKLQADYAVEIDIDDSGMVNISGHDQEKVSQVVEIVKGIVAEAEVGKSYEGTVTRVEPYGAFVEILPGKNGLAHVSRLSTEYVKDANDVVKVGDKVTAYVTEVDSQGRINISLLKPGQKSATPDRPRNSSRPPRLGLRSQDGYSDRRPSRPHPHNNNSKTVFTRRFNDHR